jgi:hypothetical protein
MKARFPRGLLIFGAIFVSGVAMAGSWQALMSPGPLGAAHDEFSGDCDSCHLPFAGIPDEGCLSCHDDLGKKIANHEGFHAKNADKPCITCHTDHHGLDAPLTTAEQLAAFDHKSTGFTLEGAHARAECDSCHKGPIGEVKASCQACHQEKDPHEGALGPDCEVCHSPQGWNEQLKTLADHQVAMSGGHLHLDCADCHNAGAHLDDKVGCEECHTEAHDGSDAPCADCHVVAAWKPAEFDHGPCTCTFAGKHQTADCLDCHPGFDFSDTPELCSGCHVKERPHDDVGECSRCHTATSWTVDRFEHDKRTKFKIDGAHLIVDCAGCHTTDHVFKGLSTQCESCHADDGEQAHGSFASFGPCTSCHTTAAFAPSTFDHATTGFPLEGHHAAAACKDCHPSKVPAK